MPSSQWLETDYVPDRREGSGLKPVWTQNGRVQVAHRFLWPWYRTLDELDSKEGEDRRGPFCLGLKIFFSLKPKMVFYDLSSSSFEGEGPEESAGFGNGPDGSGGFREKRFGLAPGGLCSGTGG